MGAGVVSPIDDYQHLVSSANIFKPVSSSNRDQSKSSAVRQPYMGAPSSSRTVGFGPASSGDLDAPMRASPPRPSYLAQRDTLMMLGASEMSDQDDFSASVPAFRMANMFKGDADLISDRTSRNVVPPMLRTYSSSSDYPNMHRSISTPSMQGYAGAAAAAAAAAVSGAGGGYRGSDTDGGGGGGAMSSSSSRFRGPVGRGRFGGGAGGGGGSDREVGGHTLVVSPQSRTLSGNTDGLDGGAGVLVGGGGGGGTPVGGRSTSAARAELQQRRRAQLARSRLTSAGDDRMAMAVMLDEMQSLSSAMHMLNSRLEAVAAVALAAAAGQNRSPDGKGSVEFSGKQQQAAGGSSPDGTDKSKGPHHHAVHLLADFPHVEVTFEKSRNLTFGAISIQEFDILLKSGQWKW